MNISIIQIPNGNDIKGNTLILILEAAVGEFYLVDIHIAKPIYCCLQDVFTRFLISLKDCFSRFLFNIYIIY